MPNGIVQVPVPINDPVLGYAPGSRERALLTDALESMSRRRIEIAPVIGGRAVRTGDTATAVMPHDHRHVLATWHKAGRRQVLRAIASARDAHTGWSRMPWESRAAIFLKAADLLAGPWRMKLNAATMLGQSKTCHQAEIDAACELIDFFRFNVHYMREIYAKQPASAPGMWNTMEYRALEGFVFAVTPFNFTSIAGNLPTAPALMGNTVVWKPASSAVYSAWYVMELLREAGLPDGVINFVPGSAREIGDPALESDELAGSSLHRLDRGVSGDVAHGRREHRSLQGLPEARRGNRRQGFRVRPPERRRHGVDHGARSRELRVPRTEVLRGLSRLHSGVAVAEG